jgi:hypothetical protein
MGYEDRGAQRATRTNFPPVDFLGTQFTPEGLRRRAVDFVPVLSESGLAERWILQAMDGCTPLQEIARAAVVRFPHAFRVQDDAFRRVSLLAEKFSR